LKLVTFEEPHYRQERLGLWIGEDDVVDANFAYSSMLKAQGGDYPQPFADAFVPPSLLSLLQGGKRSMLAVRDALTFVQNLGVEKTAGPNGEEAVFSFSKVKIKAPLPHPGKIIHTAGNFREHAKEGSASGWEFPMPHWISFLKSPSAIIGNEEAVIHPRYTKMLDHEIELAIIIGKSQSILRKRPLGMPSPGLQFSTILQREIFRRRK